jgi:hypothetical protein
METDPVSEMLCFLETMMDKVQKHDFSKCNTPLSEPLELICLLCQTTNKKSHGVRSGEQAFTDHSVTKQDKYCVQ